MQQSDACTVPTLHHANVCTVLTVHCAPKPGLVAGAAGTSSNGCLPNISSRCRICSAFYGKGLTSIRCQRCAATAYAVLDTDVEASDSC